MSDTYVPGTNFLCGVCAGVMASVVTQPFDLVKTRTQLTAVTVNQAYSGGSAQNSRSMLRAFSNVVVADPGGFAALFQGLTPRIARRSLSAAISWTLFEQVNTICLVQPLHIFLPLCCFLFSSTIGHLPPSLLPLPADAVGSHTCACFCPSIFIRRCQRG